MYFPKPCRLFTPWNLRYSPLYLAPDWYSNLPTDSVGVSGSSSGSGDSGGASEGGFAADLIAPAYSPDFNPSILNDYQNISSGFDCLIIKYGRVYLSSRTPGKNNRRNE